MDKEFNEAACKAMDEMLQDAPRLFTIEDMRFAFGYSANCKAGFTITFDKMLKDLELKLSGAKSSNTYPNFDI